MFRVIILFMIVGLAACDDLFMFHDLETIEQNGRIIDRKLSEIADVCMRGYHSYVCDMLTSPTYQSFGYGIAMMAKMERIYRDDASRFGPEGSKKFIQGKIEEAFHYVARVKCAHTEYNDSI